MKKQKYIYSEILVASIIVVICCLPLFLRGYVVNKWVIYESSQHGVGLVQVFRHDVLILFLSFLLLFYSFSFSAKRFIAIVCRIIAHIIMLVYSVDVVVFVFFNTRLVMSDVIKYWAYTLDFLRNDFEWFVFILIGFVLIAYSYLYYFIFLRLTFTNKYIRYVCMSVLVLLLLPLALPNVSYTHSWVYKNFVEYNITALAGSRQYTTSFMSSFNIAEDDTCDSVPNVKPNIIILMVESLSSYQSACFSGIYDYTPHIDMIARQNVLYLNFYANGFDTEDGVISLTTGQLPIDPVDAFDNNHESYRGFYGAESALPMILKPLGYNTEFLQASDLRFSRVGDWAESVGFNYIEGEENQFYDAWPEGVFRSAPDEALFAHVLMRMKENWDHPFFFFVSTLSSHQPFCNPRTHERSESAAISYVDEQVWKFYQELDKSKFFDNGILIIVGDHHAMVPLRPEEIEKFGYYRAAAKVPLIVVFNKSERHVVSAQYQQTDIYNSVVGLVTGAHCYSDWKGDVFSYGDSSPRFVVNKCGTDRNKLNVFTDDAEYSVLMDGDNTRLDGDNVADEKDAKRIIDRINYVRISKQKQMQAANQ